MFGGLFGAVLLRPSGSGVPEPSVEAVLAELLELVDSQHVMRLAIPRVFAQRWPRAGLPAYPVLVRASVPAG